MPYDSTISPSDVQDVMDTGLADSALTAWISAAESRVGDLPEHDSLTDSRKDEIVQFLAAALATAQDPRVDEESHESATVSYGGERMAYRDVAVMLDPTDTLASDDTAEASIGTFDVR